MLTDEYGGRFLLFYFFIIERDIEEGDVNIEEGENYSRMREVKSMNRMVISHAW